MRRNRKIKKLLSILGIISLITSGSSNLIACDKTILTSEKLAELKEKNSKIINGNKLEWIAPQEKPFNNVDDKWYVIIWRGNEKNDWKIIKFQNNIKINDSIEIDVQNNNILRLGKFGHLMINSGGFYWGEAPIWNTKNIKAVYRWNEKNNPQIPNIDYKTGKIIN